MTSTITLTTGEGNVRLYGDNLVLDLRGGGVDAMLDTRTNSPDGRQNEPEAAAEAAGDYLREPVAAERGQIIREGDAPRETDRESGDASCPDTDFSSATPAEAAPAFPKPPAHAGAADNSHRWSKLRPHCLTPECCAGVGREHCHACKRAMADREAA